MSDKKKKVDPPRKGDGANEQTPGYEALASFLGKLFGKDKPLLRQEPKVEAELPVKPMVDPFEKDMRVPAKGEPQAGPTRAKAATPELNKAKRRPTKKYSQTKISQSIQGATDRVVSDEVADLLAEGIDEKFRRRSTEHLTEIGEALRVANTPALKIADAAREVSERTPDELMQQGGFSDVRSPAAYLTTGAHRLAETVDTKNPSHIDKTAAAAAEQLAAMAGIPREEFDRLFEGGKAPDVSFLHHMLTEPADPLNYMGGASAFKHALLNGVQNIRPYGYEDSEVPWAQRMLFGMTLDYPMARAFGVAKRPVSVTASKMPQLAKDAVIGGAAGMGALALGTGENDDLSEGELALAGTLGFGTKKALSDFFGKVPERRLSRRLADQLGKDYAILTADQPMHPVTSPNIIESVKRGGQAAMRAGDKVWKGDSHAQAVQKMQEEGYTVNDDGTIVSPDGENLGGLEEGFWTNKNQWADRARAAEISREADGIMDESRVNPLGLYSEDIHASGGFEHSPHNDALVARILELGYRPEDIIPVQGRYMGGDPEQSFVVRGMTNDHALQLGKEFGQNEVIVPEGMVEVNTGMTAPATGKALIGDAAREQDFYSEAPEEFFGPRAFSLQYDFDNRLPLKGGTVRGAAIKYGDGIGEGPTHAAAILDYAKKKGLVPEDATEDQIDEVMDKIQRVDGQDGYILDNGAFVTREQLTANKDGDIISGPMRMRGVERPQGDLDDMAELNDGQRNVLRSALQEYYGFDAEETIGKLNDAALLRWAASASQLDGARGEHDDFIDLKRYVNRGDLRVLDPWADESRTGMAGAEMKRADDPTYEPRLYYYDKAADPEPKVEKGTSFVHETRVPKALVYDLAEDPQGLVQEAAGDISRLEQLIKDHGFVGYRNSNAGSMAKAVAIFAPLKSERVLDKDGNVVRGWTRAYDGPEVQTGNPLVDPYLNGRDLDAVLQDKSLTRHDGEKMLPGSKKSFSTVPPVTRGRTVGQEVQETIEGIDWLDSEIQHAKMELAKLQARLASTGSRARDAAGKKHGAQTSLDVLGGKKERALPEQVEMPLRPEDLQREVANIKRQIKKVEKDIELKTEELELHQEHLNGITSGMASRNQYPRAYDGPEPQPVEIPEFPAAALIRGHDGKLHIGYTHAHSAEFAGRMNEEELGDANYFVTNTGRIIDRKEANELSRAGIKTLRDSPESVNRMVRRLSQILGMPEKPGGNTFESEAQLTNYVRKHWGDVIGQEPSGVAFHEIQKANVKNLSERLLRGESTQQRQMVQQTKGIMPEDWSKLVAAVEQGPELSKSLHINSLLNAFRHHYPDMFAEGLQGKMDSQFWSKASSEELNQFKVQRLRQMLGALARRLQEGGGGPAALAAVGLGAAAAGEEETGLGLAAAGVFGRKPGDGAHFYSRLARAVDRFPMPRGEISNVLTYLKKKTSPEEIEHTQLPKLFDILRSQGKKSVTKSQLQQWVEAHKVEVGERIGTPDGSNTTQVAREASERVEEAKSEIRHQLLNVRGVSPMEAANLIDGVQIGAITPQEFAARVDGLSPDFAGSGVPSLEVLGTKLQTGYAEQQRVLAELDASGETNALYNVDGYVETGPHEGYKEIVLKLESPVKHGKDYTKGGHYPGVKNPLAWVRATVRKTPDERKVLFAEEFQSDIQQKQRKTGKGYAGPVAPEALERLEQINARLEELRKSGKETEIVLAKYEADPTSPERKEYYRLLLEKEELEKPLVSPYPDIPFKDTKDWTGLAVRRLLADAVDGDTGYVAWTPGYMQNRRWLQGRRIDSIMARMTGPDSYRVVVRDNSPRNLLGLLSGRSNEFLAAFEYIPSRGSFVEQLIQELALNRALPSLTKKKKERLQAEKELISLASKFKHQLTGHEGTARLELDTPLVLDGGLSPFYDQQVTKSMLAEAKRLDPSAKVEFIDVGIVDEVTGKPELVPAIAVTDKMKKKGKKDGFRLFGVGAGMAAALGSLEQAEAQEPVISKKILRGNIARELGKPAHERNMKKVREWQGQLKSRDQ